MEASDFIALAHGPLSEFLGEGFEQKPLTEVLRGCERKARAIIRRLKPFAKQETFPRVYNLRATHALFALALLYYSPYFRHFVRAAKRHYGPLREKEDTTEDLLRMMENIRAYQYMSQYQKKTVRLYDEMNDMFIAQHYNEGQSALVEDQVVLVVDFMNPVEQIKFEIETIINKLQSELDSFVTDNIAGEVRKRHLPSRHGLPLINDKGNIVRTPATYIPEWYQALLVYRMKKRGRKESLIIKRLWKNDKSQDHYAGRKTTVHNRYKLAKRLIEAAFARVPLTGHHTPL